MILEPAYKMHKIAAEYLESYTCDINDELAQNIKERANQGQFCYGFQGNLDFITKFKLSCMKYTVNSKWIGDKVYTKISW